MKNRGYIYTEEGTKRARQVEIGAAVLLTIIVVAVVVLFNQPKQPSGEWLDTVWLSAVSDESLYKETKELKDRYDKQRGEDIYLNLGGADGTGKLYYQTILRNKKGEMILQDGQYGVIEVHRNDGKVVRYSQEGVLYGESVNFHNIIGEVIRLVGEKKAILKKDNGERSEERADYLASLGEKNKVHYVDVVGLDNISELYKGLNEAYQKQMRETVEKQLEAEKLGKDDIALRFRFIDGADGLVVTCTTLQRGKEETVMWHYDWTVPMSEWELEEIWYEYNFDEMKDPMYAQKLLTDLMREMTEKLKDSEKVYIDQSLIGKENERKLESGNWGKVGEDNPIVETTPAGHYHADGTFCPTPYQTVEQAEKGKTPLPDEIKEKQAKEQKEQKEEQKEQK